LRLVNLALLLNAPPGVWLYEDVAEFTHSHQAERLGGGIGVHPIDEVAHGWTDKRLQDGSTRRARTDFAIRPFDTFAVDAIRLAPVVILWPQNVHRNGLEFAELVVGAHPPKRHRVQANPSMRVHV